MSGNDLKQKGKDEHDFFTPLVFMCYCMSCIHCFRKRNIDIFPLKKVLDLDNQFWILALAFHGTNLQSFVKCLLEG